MENLMRIGILIKHVQHCRRNHKISVFVFILLVRSLYIRLYFPDLSLFTIFEVMSRLGKSYSAESLQSSFAAKRKMA